MRMESRRDKEFRVQTDQAHDKWLLNMMNIYMHLVRMVSTDNYFPTTIEDGVRTAST